MRQVPFSQMSHRGAMEACLPYVLITASVADAFEMMQQSGTDYVLVTDWIPDPFDRSTARCLGSLSQQAIVQAITQLGDLSSCDLTEFSIQSIVQTPVTLTEAEAADPERIVQAFQRHRLSHLPILNAAEQVVRVLSPSDVWEICLQRNEAQEKQIQQHVGQFQLVIEFEAILRRIVDHVRSSLNEEQILQTAVQELGEGLGVNSCNVALYDLEQGTSTICYEYNPPLIPFQGRTARLDAYPELYDVLLAGQSLQFCNVQPNPIRGRRSILACPIVDDRQVLGDIWLINDRDYSYYPYEVRLVQQVANQCAIGLRQSRLYQAVQGQVEELTRLNSLKDDFLSTVSHEMRSPIANAKMAAQMLEIVLKRDNLLDPENPAALDRYLQILKNECQREINLINDLLDLTRINDGSEPLRLAEVNLLELIPEVTRGFLERVQDKGQILMCDLPSELSLLQTEVASLERILVELINNACKYTPPQETITIRIQGKPETLQIEMTNTGIEIPEAERDRIFERFYRIPNSDPWKHGGTGLGLALVRKLIERLQGTISLMSGSNQTQFVIELPWAIEQ